MGKRFGECQTSQTPGRIQQVDPALGSVIVIIGVVESRIRGIYTIVYYSPELGLLFFGSSQRSGLPQSFLSGSSLEIRRSAT